MSLLQVINLTRLEQQGKVVNQVSFSQQHGQKIAFAGATGSGKTTLLKMIAGLLQPAAGVVLFEGEKLKGPEEKLLPGHPSIAYLSQHFELRNHYKVSEILAMNNALSVQQANEVYCLCEIDHLLNRWSTELSGGERQRVALARLLVAAPRLLLLDEPFSNLDVYQKRQLKSVLCKITVALNISSILVSHDPVDALSWADEIIVLQNGSVVQQAAPQVVYRCPASAYVAGLFGVAIPASPRLLAALQPFSNQLTLGTHTFFRPHDFQFVDADSGSAGVLQSSQFLGEYFQCRVSINGEAILVNTLNHPPVPGTAVFVALRRQHL